MRGDAYVQEQILANARVLNDFPCLVALWKSVRELNSSRQLLGLVLSSYDSTDMLNKLRIG